MYNVLIICFVFVFFSDRLFIKILFDKQGVHSSSIAYHHVGIKQQQKSNEAYMPDYQLPVAVLQSVQLGSIVPDRNHARGGRTQSTDD